MRLPETQREALPLVCAEGFSYEQAAQICDVNIGRVRSRIHRARATLAVASCAKSESASSLYDIVMARFFGGSRRPQCRTVR